MTPSRALTIDREPQFLDGRVPWRFMDKHGLTGIRHRSLIWGHAAFWSVLSKNKDQWPLVPEHCICDSRRFRQMYNVCPTRVIVDTSGIRWWFVDIRIYEVEAYEVSAPRRSLSL
ncbi:hypothetical protein J2J97_32295 (plasmid) [Rhizobium bangladeshense]|uniref:hypothetical protein n=1 Tax=Rhizobium bangladeshense TaxID=1138189 RepID=UPI001A9A0BBC|nr:hypothetical protein [Rhizobium bangladeshense]QSY98586.1 hypothetical protein J2J97_32295 [Rhizobium bangladeshense]